MEGSQNDRQKLHTFLRELLSRLEALPGVRRAGLISDLPLTHAESVTFIQVEGDPNEKPEVTDMRHATAGYFQTMGIRLLEGELFDDSDQWGKPGRVVVSQAFVKRHFAAGQSPLGRRIKFHDTPGDSRTIIGVVSNVKHGSLEEEPRAQVFGSIWQWAGWGSQVVMEASGSREPLAAAMRKIAQSLNPSGAVSEVRSMDQLIFEAGARRRFQTSLLSIFAAIALLLALVGVYGLMTYSVKQRTPELGIRMTLGASRAQILAMVLRQAVGLTAVGVAIGIGGALALTRLLAASLYGVKATDPVTFYAVPVLILVVSAAACLVPAWKATRIDPAVALRYE